MDQAAINLMNCTSQVLDLMSAYGEGTVLEAVGEAYRVVGKNNVYLVTIPPTLEGLLDRYREPFQGDEYWAREWVQEIRETLLRKLSIDVHRIPADGSVGVSAPGTNSDSA